ncbi:MAG: hypothetical protein ACXAB4_12450, partial [Candidatus Hodarchaeales archaeon]
HSSNPIDRPATFIADIGNGTYRYGPGVLDCFYGSEKTIHNYPFSEEGPFPRGYGYRASNYTIIIASDYLLLAAEHWLAEAWWDRRGLSNAEWTVLAEQLATQLNATWYLDACVFPMAGILDNDADAGASWPFETVVLGLLILIGLVRKRRRSLMIPISTCSSN